MEIQILIGPRELVVTSNKPVNNDKHYDSLSWNDISLRHLDVSSGWRNLKPNPHIRV